MRIELTLPDGQDITLTTEHSASSYGQPVVLVNGVVIDAHVNMELDEPEVPSALEQLYGLRQIPGEITRKALLDLADEMYPGGITTGADCDAVIAEFKRRGEKLREAELRGGE